MTRIIAGVAGSLTLKTPRSGTRPTTDRVREALFSALESRDLVEHAHVLDLYAGSGALGCEALSRGAAAAVFVERHPATARVVRANVDAVLKATGARPVRVIESSAMDFFKHAPKHHFTLVLIDPPYDMGESELSETLQATLECCADGATVVVERSSRSPEPTWPVGYQPSLSKKYGETTLWWATAETSPSP